MLQSMRQLAHSWIVKALMLFLAVSFSLWGIGDIFRGNPLQKTVASVGSTTLTVQDLNRAFERNLTYARQKLSPDLTAQQAKQIGLLDKTLQDEIKRALVTQDLERLGLDVPPQAVLDMLGKQAQFRSPDGSFNKEKFLQLLRQQGLSEKSFLESSQKDLAQQMLLSALNTDQNVPQAMKDALIRAQSRMRILDVVTLDASKISGIAVPDDKTLHDFYDHNPTLFSAPETRGLTIATLSTEALAKDIVISDDQVKKEYEAKSSELSKPEQRNIEQAVVQDEDKAKQLTSQARASKDLDATAKINHETAIPLNEVDQKNLLPELAAAVFALPTGGVSDPIKTQLGWHVVQVKKIIPPGTPSFDSIKEVLREDLRRDQAIEAATRSLNRLDDLLASGHALEDIADELKLRVVRISGIDATGKTLDGKTPAEFPDKANMLKQAFGQGAGETSPVDDDKNGHYYVVRTDDITPASTKPFDKVKESVAAAWKAREQQIKATTEAQSIEKDLRSGKALTEFANHEGVTVRSSAPLSEIGDTDPSLPKDLIAKALKLKKGDTTSASIDGKEVIVRVASLRDADLTKPDPRRNRIANQIKLQMGEDRIEEYLEHLRRVFTVKINASLMDQLRQQGSDK